jgi:hypothetical protein
MTGHGVHLHPPFPESFRVIAGRLETRVARLQKILAAGEEVLTGHTAE